MKRIVSACLEQTIHFQLKDGMARSIAVRNVKEDYENYKKQMERSNVKYVIVDEKEQPDGSIIIKIKNSITVINVTDILIKTHKNSLEKFQGCFLCGSFFNIIKIIKHIRVNIQTLTAISVSRYIPCQSTV